MAVKVAERGSFTLPEIKAGSGAISIPWDAISILKSCSRLDFEAAFESSATMVKAKLPAADGVPVSLPFASVRPGGSMLPDLIERFTGSMPPVVAISALKGDPALAGGRVVVVMAKGSTIVWMLAFWVTDLRLASVAFKTKSKEPATIGFPLISPLLALSERPFGNWPWTLQTSGGTPPDATGLIVSGSLYFPSTGGISASERL